MKRQTSDLVQIAHAGGGLRLDASQISVADLMQVAHSASHKRAMVILFNVEGLSTTDMMKIGNSGNGCVIFEMEQ